MKYISWQSFEEKLCIQIFEYICFSWDKLGLCLDSRRFGEFDVFSSNLGWILWSIRTHFWTIFGYILHTFEYNGSFRNFWIILYTFWTPFLTALWNFFRTNVNLKRTLELNLPLSSVVVIWSTVASPTTCIIVLVAVCVKLWACRIASNFCKLMYSPFEICAGPFSSFACRTDFFLAQNKRHSTILHKSFCLCVCIFHRM